MLQPTNSAVTKKWFQLIESYCNLNNVILGWRELQRKGGWFYSGFVTSCAVEGGSLSEAGISGGGQGVEVTGGLIVLPCYVFPVIWLWQVFGGASNRPGQQPSEWGDELPAEALVTSTSICAPRSSLSTCAPYNMAPPWMSVTLFSAIHACVLQTFKLRGFFCWWSARRVGGLIQVGLKLCLLLYSWPPGALISVYQHPEISYFHKTLSSGRVTMHVNIAADAGNGCCEPHLRDNPMQIHLRISVLHKAHAAMRKWPGFR